MEVEQTEQDGDLSPEAAAPPVVDVASIDAEPLSDAQLDVPLPLPSSSAAPRKVETAPEEPEVDRAPVGALNNLLDSELGEIEELKHDGFYEKITERHLADMPPMARRVLHNLRVEHELVKKQLEGKVTETVSQMESRETALEQKERDFAKRQAEFAAVIEDPNLQKVLATPESELPHIHTEEGIQARIDRGVAQGVQRILEPMQVASHQRNRESSYLDFVAAHPEMKKPAFKSEVVRLVKARREANNPISTQDAYMQVKARKIVAAQQARAATQRRDRQEANKQVMKRAAVGRPGGAEIPASVRKLGAVATARWLQDHPEEHKRIRAQRG